MTSPKSLLIVGGGPAGVMAGLLFARAGVPVTVLEKHADFFRDFRGDTVHPSTMEILAQLGLLEQFLQRPHDKVHHARIRVADREYVIGDLTHLNTPAPFIAMMPQWEFLDFLRDEAETYPTFKLEMEAPVEAFIEEGGRIVGARRKEGREHLADLTIAADGRSSLVRTTGMLAVETLGAPMDVFWFRLPKADNPGDALRGSVQTGRMVVLIDRRTYWQTAFLIPKGSGEEVKEKGVEYVRSEVQRAFPDLDFPEGALASIDDLHLLEVKLDRLGSWHRSGLVAIGDAAHAMSPIGGIGINLAVQDAVAAANILAGPMARGENVDGLLGKVQQRRLFPTRIIQAGQRAAQDRLIGRVLSNRPITDAPRIVKLLDRYPLLRRIPGRIIGLGVRRERLRSPNAFAPLD
jgi:2-polyprenyl-6-methoxyphenol hydroxylase-like FAD-dependent oxidoreductase